MIDYIKNGWKKLEVWYGRKTIVGLLVLIVLLSIFGLRSTQNNGLVDEIPTTTSDTTAISLVTVATLSSESTNSTFVLGQVEATNQARLVAERGGRITAINTSLGETVSAGAILITFENAAERAQITQAEGAYQAALANQAQASTNISDSDNNLRNAQNAAVTAFSSAYSSVNQIFTSTIDQYYGNVTATIPGVRLSAFGQTNYLNDERVAFQDILSDWRQESTALTTGSPELETIIQNRITTINRLISLVDVFANILPQQPTNAETSTEDWRQQADAMIQARNQIIQLRTSLESSLSSIANAKQASERSEIAGGSTSESLASAQVLQALGSLQAAQANLNRTIVRAPIGGTVTALPVRVGDNIAPQTFVLELINDNGVEVVTYINQTDRELFAVGSQVKFIPAGVGTVTAVADRIDSQTGKIEVRIASSENSLTPGDTVRVSTGDNPSSQQTEILLPLQAIRFIGDLAHVMVVGADDTLQLEPVTTGIIRGSYIEVLDNLSLDTMIVADVRGKQVGQKVTIEQTN